MEWSFCRKIIPSDECWSGGFYAYARGSIVCDLTTTTVSLGSWCVPLSDSQSSCMRRCYAALFWAFRSGLQSYDAISCDFRWCRKGRRSSWVRGGTSNTTLHLNPEAPLCTDVFADRINEGDNRICPIKEKLLLYRMVWFKTNIYYLCHNTLTKD